MKISRFHILIAAIVSFPLYFAFLFYIRAIKAHVGDDEQVATAITICFLGLAYAGRNFALQWSKKLKAIPSPLLTALALIIAFCVLWLFIYGAINPLHSLPLINLLMYWMPFAVLSLASGTLIKFIRINQSELQEAKVSATQSESELKLLQSQISPHFLFNTLNNLYGISISRHEAIPPLLLKLSELLRYSVYEAGELFVPLKDELTYISNYIEFEKIRIGDRLVIQNLLHDVDGELKIAPMILIVFIENAFKHAKNSTDQKIYIDIEVKTWASSILFSIKNSYQLNENNNMTEKYSGFGLDNVKKRLDLLYPKKYELNTEMKDDLYSVMLQLKTKQNGQI